MTSPINKAVASGNGNRLFTEKRNVQIATPFSLPTTFKVPVDETILSYYGILAKYCLLEVFGRERGIYC